MRLALVLIFGLISSMADAAQRVTLRALSPDGSKAVITYNLEWVEVDLRTGATELIVPTVSCSFTSAAYAPDRADLALAAHCSIMIDCAATRASLFTKPAGGRLHHVLTQEGVRWNAAFWHLGPQGDEIILRETSVSAPFALGLDELGGGDGCASAPSVFTSVSAETGRMKELDYLPRGWAAVEVLATEGRDMTVSLRARNTGADVFTAEAEVAELCASTATSPSDWRTRICRDGGQEIRAAWRGGDWHLYDSQIATPLRRFISAKGGVTADEICEAKQVGRLLETDCRLVVATADGQQVISAPDGLFGDLLLSADGRWVASLAAGRGFAFRRFDLFDLTTGERHSLNHLLDLNPPWGAAR